MASVVWAKPVNASLKCNIDTACYAEQNAYCVGACIHDKDGRFMQVFMKKSDGKSFIAEAEAKGLLDVLHWQHESDRITRPILLELTACKWCKQFNQGGRIIPSLELSLNCVVV
ncbi:unnamed protein product [Trifolium pratense]|uniref:Uncharacterized protein n=2 Tax=Trifolium pratense TaxID=57577 RepID=A0ACB0IP56_TRIPR|nr:unnamed protein product [Trifolium pratense]